MNGRAGCPHPAAEKHKSFVAHLKNICRGRCSHRPAQRALPNLPSHHKQRPGGQNHVPPGRCFILFYLTLAFAFRSVHPKIAKLCAPSTNSSPFTSALPITCSTRVPSFNFKGNSASSRAGFTAQISLPRSQANGR